MEIFSGIDMVEIKRITNLVDNFGDRFLSRHFTANEIAYCKKKGKKHFAGSFAAKEAAYKALMLKWKIGFNWKHIEASHNQQNAPLIRFYGELKDLYRKNDYKNISVSISYTKDYAIASVIILKLTPEDYHSIYL